MKSIQVNLNGRWIIFCTTYLGKEPPDHNLESTCPLPPNSGIVHYSMKRISINLNGWWNSFCTTYWGWAPVEHNLESACPPLPPNFNIVVKQPPPDNLDARAPRWCKNCSTAPWAQNSVERTILRLGVGGGDRCNLLRASVYSKPRWCKNCSTTCRFSVAVCNQKWRAIKNKSPEG